MSNPRARSVAGGGVRWRRRGDMVYRGISLYQERRRGGGKGANAARHPSFLRHEKALEINWKWLVSLRCPPLPPLPPSDKWYLHHLHAHHRYFSFSLSLSCYLSFSPSAFLHEFETRRSSRHRNPVESLQLIQSRVDGKEGRGKEQITRVAPRKSVRASIESLLIAIALTRVSREFIENAENPIFLCSY